MKGSSVIQVRIWCTWLFLASGAFAQIDLSYAKVKTVSGVTNPQIVDGMLFVGDESVPILSTGAVVRCKSKFKFVEIEIFRGDEEVEPKLLREVVAKIDDTTNETATAWLVTGEGSYRAIARGYDPTLGMAKQRLTFVLGKPVPPVPPTPPPDPIPDVPSDAFDNLGQRVAKWSAGLPKRLEVGNVYAKYSVELGTNPRLEIVPAFTAIGKERLAVLGEDGPKYNDVTSKINADLSARGPMGKGVLADYLAAIARGYGVKL